MADPTGACFQVNATLTNKLPPVRACAKTRTVLGTRTVDCTVDSTRDPESRLTKKFTKNGQWSAKTSKNVPAE